MYKQHSRQIQLWLVLLTALSAALLGLFIVWVVGDGPAISRRRLVLGASDPTTTASPRSAARSTATVDLPTPTFVPVATPEVPSEAAPPSEPALTTPDVPASEPPTEFVPTEPPRNPTPVVRPTLPPPVPVRVDGSRVRLEDTAWQGGYRQAGGYAGRSATWVYGTGTDYNAMQAAFMLTAQPQGQATLRIEGMDSEGRAKTPIQITVNGREIFRGPNPLPDDDLPLASGTWGSATWTFERALLQPGQNLIRIRNLADGAFGRPPFFMLDYAEVVIP